MTIRSIICYLDTERKESICESCEHKKWCDQAISDLRGLVLGAVDKAIPAEYYTKCLIALSKLFDGEKP